MCRHDGSLPIPIGSGSALTLSTRPPRNWINILIRFGYGRFSASGADPSSQSHGAPVPGTGAPMSQGWVARLGYYANCDGSTTTPVLNINDFVCFQALFAAGSFAANCDGNTFPPILNVNDFVCFQAAFAAGCP